MSVTTDIRLDGLYGDAYLLATDRRLLAISPNGGAPEVAQIPLLEVTSVEVQDLFGSSALKVRTASEGATLARFSKTLIDKFAEVPEDIEKLVREARPDDAPEKLIKRSSKHHPVSQKRCEKCGQVIPRWMGVCPICLDKGQLLKRFFGYSIPYWPLAAFSLLLLLAGTFIGLTPQLLMRSLIDDVLNPAALVTKNAASSAAAAEEVGAMVVSLPLVGAVFVPSGYGRFLDRGWFQVNNTLLYLTPGVGSFPGVLGRKGELTCLTITRQAANEQMGK